jgi:hypothetical protein
MLMVLDPLLFEYDVNEQLVEARLDDAACILLRHDGLIPDGPEWGRLYADHIRPLSKRVQRPRVRNALDSFRQRVSPVDLPSTRTGDRCADRELDLLFPTGHPWRDKIATLLLRCVRSGQDTVLIAPLVECRNAIAHRHKSSVLVEKTVWHMRAELAGGEVHAVPCIRCERNLTVEWTRRYDESLPATGDCPFCPVDDWRDPNVKVTKTRRARPAFLDRYANSWAEPSTGGGHHWDVFLEPEWLQKRFGLDQINVTKHGVPASEPSVGSVHHVPAGKHSRFHAGRWTCDER